MNAQSFATGQSKSLSLTTGFNSFILGTAAVLAYGLEKKLAEE